MIHNSRNLVIAVSLILAVLAVVLVFVRTVAIQGPGINQPGAGEGALKFDSSGRIGINQNIGSITERLHVGGILIARKLMGGFSGGVASDRVGDPVLGGGVFNGGAPTEFAFPTSLAVGVATTSGLSSEALLVDGVLVASGTIYSAPASVPFLSQKWTLDADFNAAGTSFDSGLVNPATNDELKLKKDAFKYRRTLTIDGSKITENLTDFPVLIKLTSSPPMSFDFSKTQAGGEDIRFASTTTGLGYKYEVESWNAGGSGEAFVWVKIPRLTAGQNQDFYMYYGNEFAVPAASPTEVWDSSFVMVQHLEETSGFHRDSTSNNNNSSALSLTQQGTAVGKADGADEFDGIFNYVSIPDSNNLDATSTVTAEAWINPDVNLFGEAIVGRDIDASWFLESDGGIRNALKVWIKSGIRATTPSDVYSPGIWSHAAFTYNSAAGGTDEVKIYVNGVIRGTGDYSITIGADSSDVRIGNRSIAPTFDGKIDEVRISNSARTPGWIKASYESGNNTLLTYGPEVEL